VILILLVGAMWGSRYWRETPGLPGATTIGSGPSAPPTSVGGSSASAKGGPGPGSLAVADSQTRPARSAASKIRSARFADAGGRPDASATNAIARLALGPLTLERIQVAAMDGPEAIQPDTIGVEPIAVPRLSID